MNSSHPVFACEQQLVAAQMASDVKALDRLLDDELFYIGLAGEIGHKQDDLAIHRSGRFRITSMNLLECHTHDLGNTIVVNSLMDTAAEIDGNSISKTLRYTRVWTLKGGRWRVVAAHISEATNPPVSV